MSFCYRNLCAGQQAPELMPNELAHRLSSATGHDHHRLHLALLRLNPPVVLLDYSPVLSAADAAAVLLAVDEELLCAAAGHLPNAPIDPPTGRPRAVPFPASQWPPYSPLP